MTFGGFGSVASMMKTMKENKQMLPKKRSLFNKKHTPFQKTGDRTALHFKNTATKKELQQLELQLTQQNAKNNVRIILIAIALVLIGCSWGYWRYTINFKKETAYLTAQQQLREIAAKEKQQELLNQYAFFVNDAKKRLLNHEYSNAEFQLKKARELFPQKFEANYILAQVFLYQCKSTGEACNRAANQLRILKDEYPEHDSDLEQLNAEMVFVYNAPE